MKEPKLKDSGIPWIGQIPEHWGKDKILRIFSIIGSGTTPKGEGYYTEQDEDSAVPWINSGDLNFGELWSVNKYVNRKALSELPALKIYPKDSIILAMYGASIGKIALAKIEGCTNQACQVLHGLQNNCLKFIFYQLYSFKDRWSELSYGGTQPNINSDNIKQTWIVLPPIEEQERIAAWLDVKCGEIDELVEIEQQMISDLEAYRQAVITEAVTHGLDPKAPTKPTSIQWIPQIPKHWEIHYLRGVSAGFRKGNGITKDDLASDGDIVCIRYGDIYTKYDYYIEKVKCKTQLSKIQNPVYASYGDIYFTCSGEDIEAIGKSVAYLSDEPCLIGGDLIIMKHSQNPKFLGYSLDSIVSQSQKSFGKSKLKVVHTSVKDLKNVAIAIPPLQEQQAIADYLDAKCAEIDNLIKIKQEKIETLKQYRQSLIFEAVTGKTTI